MPIEAAEQLSDLSSNISDEFREIKEAKKQALQEQKEARRKLAQQDNLYDSEEEYRIGQTLNLI